MNLASTIRMMAEKKDAPPFDVSKADYAGAAKELTQYAKKSGGVDKNDFLGFANRMSAIASKKSPRVTSKFARDLQDLDTDVREVVIRIMRNNGIKVTMAGGGFKIEDFDIEQLETLELEEAKVQGKEVFDKTFANRTQADNFAQKNGGRVKQVGRVFYVFKEAPEDNEPASPDEGSMATQQLEFIEYAAEQIGEHIEKGGDFPEWMQNKLSTVNDNMQSLYSQIDHEDDEEEMDEAVNMDKVRSTYSSIMKGNRRGQPDDNEVGDYIPKGMTKADISALIKMLAKQGYDAKFLTKDLAPLAEAKSKEQQIADLEKMLDRISGNTSAVKMKKFALQKKIDKLKNEELEEEVELNENVGAPRTAAHRRAQMTRNPSKSGGTGYDLYHKDFSSAMKHAYDYAKNKLGVEIDPKEIDDKVASGPRKPSKGKTNSYRLMGKDGKKGVQIQVANLDDKKYELNMYKESVEMELDEAYKTPSEAKAYEDGKKAVAKGTSYDDNPNKKGTKEYTAWSKGHNDARAKLISKRHTREEVEMNEEVNLDELFESAFEDELTEAKYQVTVKGAGRETVMARTEKEAIDKATRKMGVRTHGKKNEIEVKLIEENDADRYGNTKSFLDAIINVVSEKKELDPVNKKALKKDFDDRKDKDIDNDGDVDDSDEYMHKKRQAVSKAIEKDSDKAEAEQEKEVSDKEDEPKKDVGKSGKQTKVEVNPKLDEEKGEEMTSAELEKRDEIMKSLEKKKDEFVKKYGDRAKEVMARTAIKMAKKHA